MSNVQFINGQWQEGLGHDVTSLNPARNEIIWQGKTASPEQVEAAISSARLAFESWSTLSFDARVSSITKFAELLTENKEALADTIALETGKPRWETLGEVGAMVGKINISLNAYMSVRALLKTLCQVLKRLFAISHMVLLRFTALITSRVIYQTVILFRH